MQVAPAGIISSIRARRRAPPERAIAVIGGGFSGALFALKMHAARPDWRITIVEPRKKLGRGIAYGACDPQHLLNVPVSRMDIGLAPSFSQWIAARRDTLAESGPDLASAYVPRHLFGDYMEEQVGSVLSPKSHDGIVAVRGEAVRTLNGKRGVQLADGREIHADIVVLAMGNLPPRPPAGPDRWFYDTKYFIPDPWAANALDDIDPDAPVLLIGTGLTMVDIASKLQTAKHRGPVLAVSRRGLKPRQHRAGGAWTEFLHSHIPATPLALLKILRTEIARCEASGNPWHRVFDAARPALAGVWSSWDHKTRRQFLRHLRPLWDVHRHRIAPRAGEALDRMIADGRLEILAGRITGYHDAGTAADVTIKLRGGARRVFRAGHVINCTGPGADFDKIAIPLIADLRQRRLAVPDALGLGLLTRDCAVVDGNGAPSDWLYALGPLTRPAWWEITAVPEINLQVNRLVAQISEDAAAHLTSADFLDMAQGI